MYLQIVRTKMIDHALHNHASILKRGHKLLQTAMITFISVLLVGPHGSRYDLLEDTKSVLTLTNVVG
jgi:hypothetical protein